FKNGECEEKNTDVELTPDGGKLVEELESRIKKCIGTSLLDEEGIHYSATPRDYWDLDDDFVFEDMSLVGIELKKNGNREEYFIKANPSKKDLEIFDSQVLRDGAWCDIVKLLEVE
ncbi:unnamed protein product, partial [marine sediment metagenome]